MVTTELGTVGGGGTTGVGGFWQLVKHWPSRRWITARPGVAQVLGEAAGQSSLTDRWLYLSDGGHLDNTGLVEAVRLMTLKDHPRQWILAIDASNDVTGSWSAVGDALSVIRADLGIELQRVPDPDEPMSNAAHKIKCTKLPTAPAVQRATFARRYRDPEQRLDVLVVKAILPTELDELPETVRSFALTHDDFPRSATTRQDFGDLEFEAYRAFGEYATRQALEIWNKDAGSKV